jgi:CheY-like chemotaxis protein
LERIVSNIHILVIDDNPMNLEVLRTYLENMGIQSTTIDNPLHLDEVMQANTHIDAVILDLEMPRVDGYAVYQQLRETYHVTVPIVASTVHLNEMDNVRNLGFDGFIAKPIHADRFSQQVADILQGKHVWDAG